ncbi:MAG: sodium-dependent transporter [Candidatus Anstonellaceae archaeon]
MADGWSSKKAFVLASIGAAVGIGNIWRFPYIASGHGGFWFIIPYVICLLAVGIPLFLLETGQGFHLKRGFFKSVENSKDLPFVKKHIRRLFGVFPVAVSTIILAYYMALTGWTLWFAIEFILGSGPTFSAMQQSYLPIAAYAIVFLSSFYIASKGISKGIEPVTAYLVPALFAFLLLLFLYSLSLPNAHSHVLNSFSSGHEKILDPRAWYYALSQVLFSLSVGYGIMFTYGIHVKQGRNIFSSAFEVAGADTAASLLALFSIIVLGATAGVTASGLSLSFESLPAFFASQGLIGAIVGAAFFLLLFSAAFTSVLSMVENTFASTSFLGSGWKYLIWAGIFALGLLSALSYSPMKLEALGKPILDQLDFIFGTFLAPFSALVVAFCCAYLLPHRHIAAKIGIPAKYEGLFSFTVSKIIPAALLLLIIFSQMSGLY